jgi:hypothetical protein
VGYVVAAGETTVAEVVAAFAVPSRLAPTAPPMIVVATRAPPVATFRMVFTG